MDSLGSPVLVDSLEMAEIPDEDKAEVKKEAKGILGPLVKSKKIPFEPVKEDPMQVRMDTDEFMFMPEQKSWFTDYISATRGFETPTFATLWSALWIMSTATARCMALRWFRNKPLFPNLYVFIVAPPGRCKKSTAADWGSQILLTLGEEFKEESAENSIMRTLVDFNWVFNKATGDAIISTMKPKTQTILLNNRVYTYTRGSHVAICASELTTFVNKKKYNTGLIDMLTDLYDCKEKSNIITLTRGTEEVEDVYATMFGATTPDGLKMSIPEEAFGEGFMSRVVVAYVARSERRFAMPSDGTGNALTQEDIRKRLAWILMKGRGEYTLDDEALEWWEEWYNNWRDEIDTEEIEDNVSMARYRFDVLLLKVALLFRLGEYSHGFKIRKENLLDAERLLKYTFDHAGGIVERAVENQFDTIVRWVADYIKTSPERKCSRLQLSRAAMGKKFRSPDIINALQELIDTGLVEAIRNGTSYSTPTRDKDEIYRWTEESRKTRAS